MVGARKCMLLLLGFLVGDLVGVCVFVLWLLSFPFAVVVVGRFVVSIRRMSRSVEAELKTRDCILSLIWR